MSQTKSSSEQYIKIAQAIKFVETHVTEQPELNEIADFIGMSEFHFQRLFSDWAGISPKRFLQYLTKENARKLLLNSRDVLNTAYDTGLSSSGRLHDLIVSTEAVTPGELALKGRGLTIYWGFADSPFGLLIMGLTNRGICHLQFVVSQKSDAKEYLWKEWPNANFFQDDDRVEKLALELFRPDKSDKPLRILIKGTNFQIKVWEALLRIPYGSIASYGDVATLANSPRASRAVGSALAANRIAILIPCHRVIKASGAFGQYRWGPEKKAALIAWEQSRAAVQAG